MAYRILAQIVAAIVEWLASRIERGSVAVDSDRDVGRLRAAGGRIRKWVQQSSIGPRVESDPDRPRD
jgi:hypothetical protein